MVAVLIVPRALIRATALITALATFVLSLYLFPPFLQQQFGTGYGTPESLHFVYRIPWISAGGFTIDYFVGIDGLSFPLIVLTTLITLLACAASWNFDEWKVKRGMRGYFALFLLLETGMLGTFAALDFFLFYLFWEVMLLPMYFLIGVWGGARKEYAAIKFFIYTLVGSVLMLVALLAMYFKAQAAGHSTFDIIAYAVTPQIVEAFNDPAPILGFKSVTFGIAMFFLLYIGFAIKIPVFPFHTWLPDAHVEAPTPISMILAGILLKMGGYGLLRFCYPLFPAAGKYFAYALALLGVINIIYGAMCAMAQTDFKKLVAYSSISHMGFVLLGLAIMTTTGFQGAMFQMLAHGISSPMCFFLVGVIYDRAHHREINKFGGLWLSMPKYGSMATLGFFASLGLPALCGFIGEFWVLIGTFQAGGVHPEFTWAMPMAIVAATGVILTAGYILWLIQRVYLGPSRPEYADFPDADAREVAILTPMAVLAIFLGILPQFTFDVMNGTLDNILKIAESTVTRMAAL
ncbi:MAG: NADH-quinone oxidoreductase subunit M [Phycisphaerae bacterium]|nr:NADH-quinone oxidoreductase subunit M [Phycisphaerae bacterium]